MTAQTQAAPKRCQPGEMFVAESWGVTHTAPIAPELLRWQRAKVHPVCTMPDRHSIHSYFNFCPESPDGRFVLFFASTDPVGEHGDLVIRERSSGTETTIATAITTEDAHRVACQQWADNGRAVVYHDCRDGRWFVMAVDIATGRSRILAEDRQLAFGSVASPWVPVYGCHWNPGKHRNLELINLRTGETKTPLTIEQAVAGHEEWVRTSFGEGTRTSDLSIFFPVMSPDGSKVFFKMARGNGGDDFRSPNASLRQGKFVFDLKEKRLLRMFPQWGHPSWHPDNRHIIEKVSGGGALVLLDSVTGQQVQLCLTPSDHPTISPDARYFATDANVAGRDFGLPNQLAVLVARTTADGFVVLHQFDNSKGATSWRHNHPHPFFSQDGRRLYYNVNDGPWTRLFVAEAGND